jgi:CheY-like chemotaxis protein
MTKQSPTVIAKEAFAVDSLDTTSLRDPEQPREMDALPVALVEPPDASPQSETGLAAAVAASPEGTENYERQDAPRAIGEAHTATVKSARKPTVLLVEDTIELAEVIQAALSRADVLTTHESHGGRALNRYADIKPDVILLDIGLPDISGWQFLEGIKSQHKTLAGDIPPVIVITAFGDPANRLVGKFQGVHDYLIKPFTAAEVERVVTKVLAMRDS